MYFFKIILYSIFLSSCIYSTNLSYKVYYGITIAKLFDQKGIQKLKKEFDSKRYIITKIGDFYRFSIVGFKSFQDAKIELKGIKKRYPSAFIQQYKRYNKTPKKQIPSKENGTQLDSSSILKTHNLYF